MNIIEAQDVAVRYGRSSVLDGLSLHVPPGTVYALLGRNGAGKSSLVRCLLGQQKPQRGSITLFGQDVWKHRAPLMERVGVVPENDDAPPSMSPRAIGNFLRKLFQRWDDALFVSRLDSFAVPMNKPVSTLSKGQRRQVSLAAALAHAPELLILDDPTLGLDPVARKELLQTLIEDLADRETTVLFTTHDLPAAERIAQHVGIVRGGRLVVEEPLELLKASRCRTRSLIAARPDLELEENDERDSPASLEEIFTAASGGPQ